MVRLKRKGFWHYDGDCYASKYERWSLRSNWRKVRRILCRITPVKGRSPKKNDRGNVRSFKKRWIVIVGTQKCFEISISNSNV
jgi:hypothetical protein